MFLRLFRVTLMMSRGIRGYPTQSRYTGRSSYRVDVQEDESRVPAIVPGDQGLYDSDHGRVVPPYTQQVAPDSKAIPPSRPVVLFQRYLRSVYCHWTPQYWGSASYARLNFACRSYPNASSGLRTDTRILVYRVRTYVAILDTYLELLVQDLDAGISS